ncbi:MAG: M6 family metalloprotease domain-containing protein, partial [Bacteroidales bacterium]|nr:M6 family metalloprotease domain-containing protein [Bacteroidales bacterium]
MARVTIIILLMLVSAITKATPAYPYPIEVRQPDGSTIYMLLKGDENLRYRTSLMGDRMVLNEKGYYVPTFKAPTPARASICNPIPMAGSISTLIIPVQFQDIRFSIKDPKTHFNNMMNSKGYSENNATGSVKDYFDDNLKNFIRVTFDVANVVTLDKEMAYYGENKEDNLSNESVYDLKVEEMIREACSKINPETNFAKYQYIFVYYAGYSEAEGGDPDTIWPASLDLSSSPIYLDGTNIVKVGFASELRGATGKTPSGIGAFCHEFGHILGFKDLYDTDYEDNGRSKGMWGTLSLMDYGCYNNQGRTPPYFNAIEWETL